MANRAKPAGPFEAGASVEEQSVVTDAAVALAVGVVPVLEETLAVGKRAVTTGKVLISTRTETSEEIYELALERSAVDVTRVPVGRIVETAPDVRVEGDTTIVPVLEERLVKQLVLVEEVHIRRRVEQKVAREPVTLRHQRVAIERLDADSRPIDGDP